MVIRIGFSENKSISGVIHEVRENIGNIEPRLVVFFASSSYDGENLSREMKGHFVHANVIGCTTSGELMSGRMSKDSVVVMAIDSEHVEDLRVEIVKNISGDPDVKGSFKVFNEYFNESMSDYDKMVGIVLTDGLRGAEEKVMERIGELTNITFIGGSAGDDLKFQQTNVFAHGECHTDASILALLKTRNGFDILKTQSFKTIGKQLIATEVDEAARTVIKFNDRPALEAYAEAIGKSTDEAANMFMHHPVGLMIDNEPFVRSPQRVDGTNMIFYCNIKQGMELEVLESTDIVNKTRADLNPKIAMDHPAGIINFNCILRTLELEQKNQKRVYAEIFRNIPTVGFSTYGESYLGHINQTATMLLLK